MAALDLNQLVMSLSQQRGNSNKVYMGYTVNLYDGVLSYLKNLIVESEDGEMSGDYISDGDTNRTIFTRWTEQSSIFIGGGVNSQDGFILGDNGDYTTYRQLQCELRPFMGFCIDVLENDESFPVWVDVPTANEVLKVGTSVSGKTTYPTENMSSSICETIGSNLGNIQNPFLIGIAVDLTPGTGTVDSFFNKCYPNVYKEGIGAKLASANALYAEVAFVSGSSASTVNIAVIANSSTKIGGGMHFIYFPLPLLLTDSYKSLGNVSVEIYNQVGTDCQYAFSKSKFKHKEKLINGFTPEFVLGVLDKEKTTKLSSYSFSSKSDISGANICRVRFYIDLAKEAEIKQFLAGEISEDYRKEIFKGLGEIRYTEEERVVNFISGGTGGAATGDLNTDSPYYAPDLVNWEKFKLNYRRINGMDFPAGHDTLIEQACQIHNLNTRMTVAQMYTEHRFKDDSFVVFKNPGGLSVIDSRYKPGHRYKYPQLGGVEAKVATTVRAEGYGYYWVFDSYKDAYHAKTYWIKVSTKYGTDKFKPQTVGEHYKNVAKGGYAESGTYYETISSVYNGSLFRY